MKDQLFETRQNEGVNEMKEKRTLPPTLVMQGYICTIPLNSTILQVAADTSRSFTS